jgi:hypothetical protein
MNIRSDIFGNQIIELERISVVGFLMPPPVLHCPPLTDSAAGSNPRSAVPIDFMTRSRVSIQVSLPRL